MSSLLGFPDEEREIELLDWTEAKWQQVELEQQQWSANEVTLKKNLNERLINRLVW